MVQRKMRPPVVTFQIQPFFTSRIMGESVDVFSRIAFFNQGALISAEKGARIEVVVMGWVIGLCLSRSQREKNAFPIDYKKSQWLKPGVKPFFL